MDHGQKVAAAILVLLLTGAYYLGLLAGGYAGFAVAHP